MAAKMTKAQLESELKKAQKRIAALEHRVPAMEQIAIDSEKKFQALIENSRDVIALVAADGTTLYKSPSVEAVMGYKPEELVGKNSAEMFHPQDAEKNSAIFGRVLASPGVPISAQARYRHKNGEWKWVDITANNLLDNPDVGAIVVNYRDMTDQIRMQEQLQKDESRYRSLFEESPLSLWEEDFSEVKKKLSELKKSGVTDLRGYLYSHPEFVAECAALAQVLDVNKATLRLFEADRKEDLLKKLDTIISHENMMAFADELLALDEGQTTYFWEGVNYTATKKIQAQFHLSVLPGYEESLSRVIVSMMDVTTSREAEEAQKKVEIYYRSLFEQTHDAVFILDLEGNHLAANQRAADMLGYKFHEMLGLSVSDTSAEPQQSRQVLRRLLNGEHIPSYERIFRKKDGSLIPVEINVELVREPNGVPLHIQSVVRDISERKLAEESLKKSEERFRALIANTGDLILVVDEEGSVNFASPSAERIFGYSPQEAVGRSFLDWVHPDDVAETITAFQNRKETAGEAPYMVRVRARHKDGTWRYVEALGTNLLDDPSIRGIVVNIRDVTEQKRAELEKQALVEIMQGMAFSQNLKEFLSLVHYSISQVIRAENLFVTLHNPLSGLFEDVYCVDEYDEPLAPSNREGTLTAYIFRTGNPLLINNKKFEEMAQAGDVEQVGALSKSWLGAPLKTGGKTIGVMAVQDYETAGLYSEKDLAFLASISGQVASAVERKQAEEKLRESEKRFTSAFENAAIGMALVSPEGRWLKVNQALCSLVGYEANELMGMTFQDITHPDDLDTDLEYVRETLEGRRQTYQMEKRYYHKNGHIVWVLLSVSLVRNEHGDPLYFISQIQDVTERKQAEEKFRGLLESAPDAVVVTDGSGKINLVNSQTEKLFGYQRAEIIGQPVEILVPNRLREKHITYRAGYAVDAHNRPMGVSVELYGQHRNGSEFPVEISLGLLQTETGTLISVSIRDVSERKRIENVLRESEENYRLLIENAGEALYVVQNGRIVFANPMFEKITREPASELIGMNVLDFVPSQKDRMSAIRRQKLLLRGKIEKTQNEYKVRLRSGEELWVNVSEVRTIWKGEEAVLTFATDITERKQAEEALRRAEEKYRAIFENSLEGIFQSTPAGRFITVNPALARMWGYDSPEDLLTSVTDIANQVYGNPAIRAEHMRLLNEQGGDLSGFEYQALCKDGSTIWVSENVHSILDADGALLYFEGTVENISSRKQAEEALRASESSLQGILQSTADGLLAVSAENKVLFINEHFSEMWKIPQEVVSKKDDTILLQFVLDQLIDPQDFINKVQELYKSRQESFDFIHFKDGRVFERFSKPITTSQEEYAGRVWSFRDITKRQLAENKIIESEQRYRSLFEDSPISLWEDDYSAVKLKLDELRRAGVTDFETYFARHPETAAECTSLIKILDANKSSVKLFNAKNKEELLAHTRRLLDMEVIGYRGLINLASGMTRFEWEGVNKKLSGELMNIKLTWSVAPGHEEDLAKVIISIIDITERKRAEAEINRQLSELETLYESGLAISRLLTPKEIAQKMIEVLSRRMNWHHIGIRQYQAETNSVKLIGFHRPGVGEEEAEEFIAKMNLAISNPAQGLSGWVTLHGQPLRVPNVQADDRYAGVFPEIRSGLYVPLQVGERVIGSISVESEVENAFTEHDERLLVTLAGQSAIAFENANLFEMTQREIIVREQVEAALQKQTDELLELNDRLEQRVKERTAEIDETRKRLELATDAAGLGIWEWEISTGSVIWDNQMFNIYGTSPEIFNGKIDTQMKFIHPEDRGVLTTAVQDIMENKRTTFKHEYRILHQHGDTHTLFEQGVAVFGPGGTLERIIGIVNDVTPQKQAEQDLQESEAYARLLFDAAPDPVSVADLDGLMLDVNRLFEQQHQVNREDIRYRHISELNIFPDEQLAKGRDYTTAILEGRDVPPVELDFYYPGGGIHTLEMRSYPIEVKGRQLVLSTSRDITIHKKAEESLRFANSEMERALRMKDEFLANMSHELRTPLNAVLGMSESLEEQIAGPLNEKQLKYIRTIGESGRHLLELINDILDLSKIEAGRMELNISQVSVSSLCEASLRMVKEQAQKKSQQITLQIDPEVKVIMGDERRLKQSLVNLLSNAVKFTPNDQRVGVEVKGNPRNQTVTFTVWDEGIGIAPEELNKIFKPFVQLDAGLTREFSGTGLGLVLVAQMVRLHGGSVSVESKEGRGSRFSITLPWVDVEGVSLAKGMEQKTEAGSTSEEKRDGRILIVEDTESIVLLLSEYLRHKGYQVMAARNGMEGVMLARKEKPDLILMDVMMPVMDGVEAARQIRAEKELREIPIIALTALAMPGDKERCLQAGMNDYLSKPVQMKELESLIVKHMHKKG